MTERCVFGIMRNQKRILAGLVSAMLLLAGCDTDSYVLNTIPADERTTEAETTIPASKPQETGNVEIPESTSETESVIEAEVDITTIAPTEDETAVVEGPDHPVYDNGVWTSYFLGSDQYTYADDEKTTYVNIRFPVIYVPDNDEAQIQLYKIIAHYMKNDFDTRHLLDHLEIDTDYVVKNDTDFLSFMFVGTIRHTDPASQQYHKKVPDQYCLTMNRYTGYVYRVEELMTYDKIRAALSEGRYSFVEGNEECMDLYTGDELAELYFSQPAIQGDDRHYKDFFLADGALNLMIYVGYQNGFYLSVRIEDQPIVPVDHIWTVADEVPAETAEAELQQAVQ